MIRRTIALVTLLTVAPSLALAAEDTGPAGHVTEIQVNTVSSDAYLQYHGRVFIDGGNGKGSLPQEYRWGGTSCGSRVLSDAQVALLMRGLDSGLRVAPLFQPGQGSAQCVVGFNLVP